MDRRNWRASGRDRWALRMSEENGSAFAVPMTCWFGWTCTNKVMLIITK